MADASAPSQSSEAAFAYYVTLRVADVFAGLMRMQEAAEQRGARQIEVGIERITADLLRDVSKVAVEFAGLSEGAIVRKMIESHTASRPITTSMESHVRSEPGPLGSVRVALISELDKIVNPVGDWGPFWRAQEYGTGTAEVETQIGRRLYGTFEPSGGPPDPAQRGLDTGHDLFFEPGGVNPGQGRITVDLPGRHFLRDGSSEIGARYVQRMLDLQQVYIRRLGALMAQLAGPSGRGRKFRGVIEA